MRIGLLAPPWIPVPPPAYGGIEEVVALLARGLADEGHEVVLAAAPGSRIAGVRVLTYLDEAPSRIGHAWDESRHVLPAAHDLRDCDVIVDHSGMLGAVAAAHAGPPALHVVHGTMGPDERAAYRGLMANAPGLRLAAISHAQRHAAPDLRFAAVLHNALDTSALPFAPRPGAYLAFLGRVSPDKGVLGAIEVAERLGMPLRIAAKCRDAEERAHMDREIAPRLTDRIRYVGEVDRAGKAELLAGAAALLFPIEWEEPFGMVMIEAMACGTPVLALRRGAVPEVVADGETGFVRDDLDGLVEAGRRLAEIDRRRCRARVVEHFSPGPFTRRYLEAIAAVTESPRAAGIAAGGAGPLTADVRLPRAPEAAATARAFVDSLLPSWTAPAQRADARLLVSETVTGAVLDGEGEAVRIRATIRGDRLHVEVAEDGGGPWTGPALLHTPPPGVPAGRGLHLLEALAERWGWRPRPSRVWFVVRLTAGPPVAARPDDLLRAAGSG